ncbi:hypothetical protein BC332_30375 [Capsicum chinense]|nr:hypothetical protein BC332_30375 [Capsicum chinense]
MVRRTLIEFNLATGANVSRLSILFHFSPERSSSLELPSSTRECSKYPAHFSVSPFQVSDEGDVLYVFPKDYRSNLMAKSFKMKIEPLLEKAKLAGEYLVRVSFGTTLIASIVIVYTTIIAILSSRSEEDNRGRRGRSYDNGFTFYFSPTDLFWYWDPYYYRRRRVHKESGGMNFIESVFSFVFGDGDPNQEIEEERWKLVGQYISSNGGVVAAEELAPFLDVEIPNKTDDESYVLPVLLRFDGQPEVDEEGNILYRFPSLQRTAAPQRSGRKEYVGKRWTDWVGQVERFLQEKKWQFSKTSSSERALVIGLGGLNLFGVIILGTMLNCAATTLSPLKLRPSGVDERRYGLRGSTSSSHDKGKEVATSTGDEEDEEVEDDEHYVDT